MNQRPLGPEPSALNQAELRPEIHWPASNRASRCRDRIPPFGSSYRKTLYPIGQEDLSELPNLLYEVNLWSYSQATAMRRIFARLPENARPNHLPKTHEAVTPHGAEQSPATIGICQYILRSSPRKCDRPNAVALSGGIPRPPPFVWFCSGKLPHSYQGARTILDQLNNVLWDILVHGSRNKLSPLESHKSKYLAKAEKISPASGGSTFGNGAIQIFEMPFYVLSTN